MVKTPSSDAEEAGSISHQGSKFPGAMGCSQIFFFLRKARAREIDPMRVRL